MCPLTAASEGSQTAPASWLEQQFPAAFLVREQLLHVCGPKAGRKKNMKTLKKLGASSWDLVCRSRADVVPPSKGPLQNQCSLVKRHIQRGNRGAVPGWHCFNSLV